MDQRRKRRNGILHSPIVLRSCRQGWENGDDIYAAIREGLGETKERSGKTARKERMHVIKCFDTGVDWRIKARIILKASIVPEGMEGNISNLFADRMKDRGMSWTIKGAQRMGKAIQLASNGELSNFCGRKPILADNSYDSLCFDLFRYRDAYLEPTVLPALESQYAFRPWGRVLKDLTTINYLIN